MEPNPGQGQGITVEQLLRAITPRAWATPAIAVLLVVCFAASVAFGVSLMSPTGEQLIAVGADFGPFVAEGQWWRLITATLLHAGVVHLAFNLWAFWNGGQFCERLFGNWGFLAIYWLSAVGGELASLAWRPLGAGVGASGAVFGVYGALLAFMLLHRGVLPRAFLLAQRNSLLAFIGYNVVFSFMQRNINLAAHAGGLATGFVAGALLSRDLLHPHQDAVGRALRALGLACLLALGAWATMKHLETVPDIKADQLASDAYDELQRNHLPQSVALYTRALELQPNGLWLINRGMARLQLRQDVPAAFKDLRDGAALSPSPMVEHLLCQAGGQYATQHDEWVNAERDCSTALEASPGDPELLAWRALTRGGLRDLDGALSDAQTALKKNPDAVLALRVSAETLGQLHRNDEASAACEKLVGRKDVDAADFEICAEIAARTGELERAWDLYERAVKLDPSARVFVARAALFHKLGRSPEAQADLDRALELEPDNVEALMLRGDLAAHDERDADAFADYQQVLRLVPNDAVALNNRAWLKVLRGDFVSARTDADRAVTLTPDDAAATGTRCFVLVGLKELAAAKADCAKAAELDPDEPFNRGMAAYLDHRFDDARREWAKALAASPHDRRAVEPYLTEMGKR